MSDFVPVQTAFRRILSPIPHPDSLPVLRELERLEPRSMSGFPPVVWERAEGCSVWDGHGNQWLDFTSAIILANAGHAPAAVAEEIRAQLEARLYHSYCNPSRMRLRAVQALGEVLPAYLDKTFLLTTGSEAVECALKVMRLHGRRLHPDKYHLVSFTHSFHGRTMGAQAAGGFPDQRAWMGAEPPGFHHLPFPECARCPWGRERYEGCGEECLQRGLAQLRETGLREELVAGVITETFQGPTVAYLPPDYAQALRAWATERRALLVFDEIQAGFGRSGRWWGFEHYGVEADLICLGKGMTSSLPLAAVAGRGELLDLAEPGDMSSTHTGNPLCCAALLGNLRALQEGGLVENAARQGETLEGLLGELPTRFPQRVGSVQGRGLAWAVYLTQPDRRTPDAALAREVTDWCRRRGLLVLGTPRGTLKLAPPLCIGQAALQEGVEVIREAIASCTA